MTLTFGLQLRLSLKMCPRIISRGFYSKAFLNQPNFEVPWTWEKESRGPKPKSLKTSRKSLPGPGSRKSEKSLGKSPKTHFQTTFFDFLDLFRDLFQTFGTRPRETFSRPLLRRFWLRAPRLLWPRFGWVRLRFGVERFERFRFSVPAVPLMRGFLCVSAQFHREDGSGFGSKTVPAVPVPRSVPAKTVPTVPVSGSGSVPGPPCKGPSGLRCGSPEKV